MIQRDESAGSFPATRTLCFEVRVEVAENGPSAETVAAKLADALIWAEGCNPIAVATSQNSCACQAVGDQVV